MSEKNILDGIQRVFRAINDNTDVAIILSLRGLGCWKTIEELRDSVGELFEVNRSYIDSKRLKNLEERNWIMSKSDSLISEAERREKYSLTPIGQKIINDALTLVEVNQMVENISSSNL